HGARRPLRGRGGLHDRPSLHHPQQLGHRLGRSRLCLCQRGVYQRRVLQRKLRRHDLKRSRDPDKQVARYLLSVARFTALAAVLLYAAAGVSHVDAAEVGKPMLQLSETDNDRTVDVHVGDTIRLTFPENATTGYRWALDRHDDVVDVVAEEPRYPGNA